MARRKANPHHLQDLVRRFFRFIDDTPFDTLTSTEREQLCGHFFAGDTEFVDQVALVLDARQELYPDAGTTAAELWEDEEAAGAWFELHHYLRWLSDRCLDSYIRRHASAIVKSKRVTQAVIDGFNRPALAPDLPHRRRLDLMLAALLILKGDRERRARKRAATLRRKAAAVTRGHRQQKAAAREHKRRKQQRKASLLDRLGRLLRPQGEED